MKEKREAPLPAACAEGWRTVLKEVSLETPREPREPREWVERKGRRAEERKG